jgi:hypothetical protein
MRSKKYKYMESYKNCKILIYGISREWWWEVVANNKLKKSPICYFSVQSALNGAKKYIDMKVA